MKCRDPESETLNIILTLLKPEVRFLEINFNFNYTADPAKTNTDFD